MAGSAPRSETSAGAVVFHRSGTEARYLLILDAHGNWGFPKGHVEPGESLVETARRELLEETALAAAVNHGPLGVRQWSFGEGADRVEKTCHYFLFEAEDMTAAPQTDEGIAEVAWLPPAEARERLTFAAGREVLAVAAARLDLAPAPD